MEIENKYKYYAFISYKREDEEWAKWLQHKLEHYKLPSNLNGRTDLPKEIRPVFKDTSELNPGNLPQQIHDALEQSKFLIVICSPRSAQSEWVNKEVETFIGMGKTDRIIPFIIDGKAFAKDPVEECFPLAIRNLPSEQEILGANIGEMGRDAAAVKVVAQMFGLKFDELWQRHEREQRKKRRWITIASVVGFIVMAGVALWMYAQRQQTLRANWKMKENQAKFMSKEINELTENGDIILAQRLALEILPKNLKHPNRPYTAEGEAALRNAVLQSVSTLKGHTDQVYSVAFSPDGEHLASASSEETVRVWNISSNSVEKTLIGHTWYVTSVAYSPDGSRIASIDGDGLIIVWDAYTGKKIKSIQVIGGERIYKILFAHDGKHLYFGDRDGCNDTFDGIFVLNIDNGQIEKRLKDDHADFDAYISKLSLSEDGKLLASQSFDGSVTVWDVEQTIIVDSFPSNNFFSGIIENNNKMEVLTVKPYDNNPYEIGVFNLNNKMIYDFHRKDEILSMLISHNGEFLFVCYSNGIVEQHNIKLGKTVGSVKLINPIGSSFIRNDLLKMSPDGKYLAGMGIDIGLWNLRQSDEMIHKITGHKSRVNTVMFNSNGDKLVSTSYDRTLKVWDVNTMEQINSFSISEVANEAVFCKDDRKILFKYNSYNYNNIFKVDIASGKVDEINGESKMRKCYCYDSIRNHIIICESEEYTPIDTPQVLISIIDASSLDVIQSIKSDYPIQYVSVNPKNDYPIVTTSDTIIQMWNCESQTPTKYFYSPLLGRDKNFAYACVNSSGELMITGFNTIGDLNVWDVKTGQILYSIESGREDLIHSAFFSSDGEYIVTASGDRKLKVWNAKTGKCICSVSLLEYGDVQYAFFSNDGNRIAAACDDDIILIDFPPLQDLIDQTRERFKDYPLTPEERRMYYLE